MSLAEIKDSIAGLTLDERLEVAAWIAHLNRTDDSPYREGLDRRLTAMDDGRKTTRQELERLHTEISANGR